MKLIKSRLYTLMLMLGIATVVCAVPSSKLRKTFTLIDGTRVEAVLIGNEHRSFYRTDDGQMVVKTDQGYELRPLVLEPEGPEEEMKREGEGTGRRRVGSVATAPLKPQGRKYVPVLLVEFQDMSFSVRNNTKEVKEYYDLYCNGTRNGFPYTGHGSFGSIKDYFQEQSEGIFDPEFVVIGPVRLSKNYAYYGRNSGSSKDVYYSEFRKEALSLAYEEDVDWTLFDNDGNGSVDMVFFLYAGLGENYGGDEGTIWPKEETGSVTIDNTKFATNACTCELQPAKRDKDGNIISTRGDGIGVFIHELSHAMGLPDFYDTNYKAFGMDIWSVMDYGEYANNGYNPVGYTAYERDFMGWRPLITVTEPTTLRIPCFSEGGYGYKIVNDRYTDEYYVLENRQGMGWDSWLGSHCPGMLVTHVDYSSSRWNANTVNTDANHQRMTVLAANDLYTGSVTNGITWNEYIACLQGQPFPGALDAHELTDDTNPASVVYAGGYMGKPIVDIQEVDGIITLKFRPRGTLEETVNLRAEDITDSGFTAMWDDVPFAQCYNVRLLQYNEVIAERDSVADTSTTFTDLQNGEYYSFEVQPVADDYLNPEWSRSDVFCIDGNLVSGIPESEQTVRIFTSGGMFVSECYADEIHRLGLRSGVYILRPMKGVTRKIFIR